MTQLAEVRVEPGACKAEHRKLQTSPPSIHAHWAKLALRDPKQLSRSLSQPQAGSLGKKSGVRVRPWSAPQTAPSLGLFLPETLHRDRKRKPLLLAAEMPVQLVCPRTS